MSLRIIPTSIFNKTNPIVIGVECIECIDKCINIGANIMQNNVYIGKIDAIQINTNNVTSIMPGDKAIIKINSENIINTSILTAYE